MKLNVNKIYNSGERKFLVAYRVRYKITNIKEKIIISVFTHNVEKAQKKAREKINQFEDIKSAILLYVEDLANSEIIY